MELQLISSVGIQLMYYIDIAILSRLCSFHLHEQEIKYIVKKNMFKIPLKYFQYNCLFHVFIRSSLHEKLFSGYKLVPNSS